MRALGTGVLCGLVLLGTAGCTVVYPYVPPTGQYYINPEADFAALGRVVLLEPAPDSEYPEQGQALSAALTQALQKKHLFNVDRVDRGDPVWSDLELDRQPWDLEHMRRIRRRLGADGVIVGRVTDYRPYPYLLMGLHLRLVDLRDGRVVWGLEQVWDSQDADVQKRMRGYYYSRLGTPYEPLGWQILHTSGQAFGRFVADEVARTLPEAHQILRLRAVAGSENLPPAQKTVPIRQKMVPLPLKEFKLVPAVSTITMEPH
jgi:hypothetical protein